MDDLVKRAQRGDANAFTELMQSQMQNMYKIARAMLRDVEEVEEVPAALEEYDNVEWMETMKCLDEKYRLVMILYYVNGLNTEEIGSVLHIPASTVRTRLARGRSQIAAAFCRMS